MQKLTRKQPSQNKKIIAFSIMVAFFVLFIVAIILVKNKVFDRNSWSDNLSWDNQSFSWEISQNYYIWNSIIQTWIIEKNPEFWWFTHYLIQNWEQVLWLKSSEVDLWEFTWDVQIKWTIVERLKDLWIVEISELQPIESESSSSTSTGSDTIMADYNFWKYWLKIELKNSEIYEALIQDDIIKIRHKLQENELSSNSSSEMSWSSQMSWDSVIMSISPFVCEKGSSTKDCEMMWDRFKKLWFENFKSVEWITYFKIWEWKQWFFTNANLWGYYVTAQTDKQLMNFSSDIHAISADDVKSKISRYIGNICYDFETKMKTIDWLKLQMENKEVVWYLTWSDENMNKVECKIKIGLWDTISTSLLDLKVTWTASSSTSSAVINMESWTSSSDSITWNMLEYNKPWSFKIYLPKKLTFKWIIDNTEENFQVAWLQCYRKLIATQYTNKDSLESDPIIKIYSCLSDHDDNTLITLIQGKNMIYKRWVASDKRFIILYKDSDAKVFADQILTY